MVTSRWAKSGLASAPVLSVAPARARDAVPASTARAGTPKRNSIRTAGASLPIVSREAVVAVPVETIFDYLQAGEHVGDWVPDLLRSERITPGPIRPGSRFRYVFRVFGYPFEVINEVDELVPPRVVGFRAITGIRNHGQFTITPLAPNLTTDRPTSRVALLFTFTLPSGPVGLVIRALPIESMLDRYAQTTLARLARRLEAIDQPAG